MESSCDGSAGFIGMVRNLLASKALTNPDEYGIVYT